MEVEPTTPALSGSSTQTTIASQPSFTILRIKRKRNEEPLDALVVESRVPRKKSRGGVGMFQYAQTVEDSDWENAARQQVIQDEISRLAREAKVANEARMNMPPPAEPQDLQVPLPSTSRVPRDDHTASTSSSRRYTIVDPEVPEPRIPSRRYPSAPPKVYSYKELEARKNARDFKMYDAVPSTTPTPMSVDESSDMDNFLPMLKDYLSLQDTQTAAPATPLQKSSASTSSIKNKISSPSASEDDYVWDVFYHRPATLSEYNAAAANVGTVTGLPPSFGDTYDSASDSEEEFDEADEDSNAEDFYKNDYPEEEEGSSDEWHEDSEHEDILEYPNDQEDYNWR